MQIIERKKIADFKNKKLNHKTCSICVHVHPIYIGYLQMKSYDEKKNKKKINKQAFKNRNESKNHFKKKMFIS